ncbi:MAG: flagellar hook capping FlgD N-terminal domain-containing protein, partial [Pseudomonadota bacterium]|nr:flagellar hook capping FlgD N-terminal domain-containing protein [Pseudomonadota bacterium]
MSTIDQNSQNSLSAILDKLGISRADEKKQAAKNTLGQEDFLKLMTTQLQNQDPFAPMENGDFIAQMAQFSTVTGITEMSNNMKALNDKIDSFR